MCDLPNSHIPRNARRRVLSLWAFGEYSSKSLSSGTPAQCSVLVDETQEETWQSSPVGNVPCPLEARWIINRPLTGRLLRCCGKSAIQNLLDRILTNTILALSLAPCIMNNPPREPRYPTKTVKLYCAINQIVRLKQPYSPVATDTEKRHLHACDIYSRP